jgi:hypothetical protein
LGKIEGRLSEEEGKRSERRKEKEKARTSCHFCGALVLSLSPPSVCRFFRSRARLFQLQSVSATTSVAASSASASASASAQSRAGARADRTLEEEQKQKEKEKEKEKETKAVTLSFTLSPKCPSSRFLQFLFISPNTPTPLPCKSHASPTIVKLQITCIITVSMGSCANMTCTSCFPS